MSSFLIKYELRPIIVYKKFTNGAAGSRATVVLRASRLMQL